MHSFRPDIEGFRGLAVLLVILFHFGFSQFEMGYLGVDIFFVISGFLITSIIQKQLDDGSFSLIDFYRRRFLRIFPALAFMMVITGLAFTFILLPIDLPAFGINLLSSALYVSNFVFAWQSDYFSTPAAANPFLHTWSLSVEEQFYLCMPLLLMLRPKTLSRLSLHLLILVPSLVLAVALVDWSPSFFLSPLRFWEFAAGAVACTLYHRMPDRITRHLSTPGLLIIGIVISQIVPIPAICATLLTVVAVCMVLVGTKQSLGGRALSLGSLRFFGKISYSAYLWHWPVVAAYTYISPRPIDWLVASSLFILIVSAGYVSWRFVEQPIRTASWSNLTTFICAGTITFFIAVWSILLATGVISPSVSQAATQISIIAKQKGNQLCFDSSGSAPSCKLGVDGKPSFVVWGDSHAAALASKISLDAKNMNRSGILLATPACVPVLDVINWWGKKEKPCFNDKQELKRLLDDPYVSLLFIHGYWEKGALETYARVKSNDPAHSAHTTNPTIGPLINRLKKTIEELRRPGLQIVLIGNVPLPRFDVDVPRILAVNSRLGIEPDLGLSLPEFQKITPTEEVLRKLADDMGVGYVAPSDFLCPDGHCHSFEKNAPYFFDTNHLSVFGASRIDAFKSVFASHP